MSADGLASPGSAAGPLQVLLNVYDVAQGDSKGTVVRLNNLVGPKGLGLGGVFHGAIVLGTVEFSFGFCEQGTGVYAVKAGHNPMYTFRETIDLGPTHKGMQEIRSIIQQLKQEWPGGSYDLLYRNCCHFCVDLAARLDVGPVPGWLNRFASGAAATINITQDTVKTVQEFGAEVGRFWSKTLAAASQQQQQLAEKLQQQQHNWRSSSQHQQQQHQQQQQQQQQQRSVSATQPRSAQPAGTASQAGQQLWSSFTQAGQQIKATTSKLAQAAAAKTGSSSTPRGSSSSAPRFGSFALASMSLASMAPGSSSHSSNAGSYGVLDEETQQQQQQQQQGAAASNSASGPASGSHTAAAAAGPEPLSSTLGTSGSGDRGSLLLGAQPKLSKQYRLSAGGRQDGFAHAADTAVRAAASSGGGGGRGGLQHCESDGGLMPFLSVDEGDPFVALVGEDDAEDDAQQRAAVENAVLHSPAAHTAS